MMLYKETTLKANNNAFGNLIRSFRQQRKWSQAQLAQKWGHTREYVSLIERGERKLDKQTQVYDLADILGIPSERLEAIGKGIPVRRALVEKPTEAGDVLLEALLEPALASTKLSWLLWVAGDQQILVAQHLTNLNIQLENALNKYRGQFLMAAQQMLAYTHDMQGQMAFDQLKFMEANGHFQDMLDLGEELGDPNIIALAHIHRADVLRKRGRYEPAARMLTAVSPTVEQAEDGIRGLYYQMLARTHAQFGAERLFLEAIDNAEDIARNIKETIDTQYHQFNLVEVLQERAQGYARLWQPKKALVLCSRIEKMRSFRPIRSMGAYMLLKAQVHAYSGEMETGIDLALEGLKLASVYGSRRHMSRVQEMYDRLSITELGQHARMKDLKEALMNVSIK